MGRKDPDMTWIYGYMDNSELVGSRVLMGLDWEMVASTPGVDCRRGGKQKDGGVSGRG